MSTECLTCLSLSGEKRISPGPIIYTGRNWIVDHAYPTSLKGWLVLVPKRHVEAMHELTKEEFIELAELQYSLTRVMHTDPQIQKEYMMCFAEGAGFAHVHIHVVAKPYDLPASAKGPNIFTLLNVPEADSLSATEVRLYSEAFSQKLEAMLSAE